ncbi:nucleotidyl transferase AbiEii/AbiGii toxin family protein [Corynebacterium variabile]|uniref:nucleotidyl transferase AbiEii/AbiGii toxin family protein n=1 Tax=Corynebacterium variabile TaxID=1727 RepID=UPI0035E3BE19
MGLPRRLRPGRPHLPRPDELRAFCGIGMDGTSRFRPLAGLSDRLKLSARDQNIEPQTLRGRYFRQRFFARLSQHYPDQWVLTGATALELRADSPRSTSDLDTITTLALNDLGTAISA